MKLTELITLLKAGYTKEEINELRDLQRSEEPEQEKEPEEEQEAEPEQEPEPHYVDEIAKLTKQVNELTELLQDNFRKDAEGKAPDPADGDQILKDIIEKGVIK